LDEIRSIKSTSILLAESVEELRRQYSEFNTHNLIVGSLPLEELFGKVSSTLVEWGNSYGELAESFNKTLTHNIRYQKHEAGSIAELLKFRQLAEQSYVKAFTELDKKKEVLFNQKNIENWGIDLTKCTHSRDDVIADRDLAKSLMLPEVFQMFEK